LALRAPRAPEGHQHRRLPLIRTAPTVRPRACLATGLGAAAPRAPAASADTHDRPPTPIHAHRRTQNMIGSETLHDYLERLASREPTPGGGAAAALHAAQGAALIAMVARYTTGAKYAEHEEQSLRIAARADSIIPEALRLAD